MEHVREICSGGDANISRLRGRQMIVTRRQDVEWREEEEVSRTCGSAWRSSTLLTTKLGMKSRFLRARRRPMAHSKPINYK